MHMCSVSSFPISTPIFSFSTCFPLKFILRIWIQRVFNYTCTAQSFFFVKFFQLVFYYCLLVYLCSDTSVTDKPDVAVHRFLFFTYLLLIIFSPSLLSFDSSYVPEENYRYKCRFWMQMLSTNYLVEKGDLYQSFDQGLTIHRDFVILLNRRLPHHDSRSNGLKSKKQKIKMNKILRIFSFYKHFYLSFFLLFSRKKLFKHQFFFAHTFVFFRFMNFGKYISKINLE